MAALKVSLYGCCVKLRAAAGRRARVAGMETEL